MSPTRLEFVSSRLGEKYVLGGERSSRSSTQPLSQAVDELGGDLPRNGVPFLDVPDGSRTPVASPGVTQAPYLVTIHLTRDTLVPWGLQGFEDAGCGWGDLELGSDLMAVEVDGDVLEGL